MEGLESEFIEVVHKCGDPEQLPRILAAARVIDPIVPKRAVAGEPEHIKEEQTSEGQNCESEPLLAYELKISKTTATSVQFSQQSIAYQKPAAKASVRITRLKSNHIYYIYLYVCQYLLSDFG